MSLTGRAGCGDRRRRGVVLMVVLFFALLLSTSIFTFLRRSLVDSMIARNRDNAARAEALARGGVRLAQALLLQDRIEEAAGAPVVDSGEDFWARPLEIQVSEDATLFVEVEDSGGKLNLNSLFEVDDTGAFRARDETEEFLRLFLEAVIDELRVDPAQKALLEPRELAQNLIDWVDENEESVKGGPEDAYYQRQDPPYRAANQPLFSVQDLRLVEGFTPVLVDGLAEYVTVYPFAPGGCDNTAVGCGINVNTAPAWVLKLLYFNDGIRDDLADEDTIQRLWDARQEGVTFCMEGQSFDECQPISEIIPNPGTIFPPPTVSSQVFVVTSRARVGMAGEVERTVVAVVDRSDAADPRLLSWRVR